MGATFEAISDQHRAFIEAQPIFFVATSPSGDEGRVNLSPKGYDSVRVLGPNDLAYLDLTGSGAETIAHLRENGRITLMWCSFGDKPLILRCYGQGRVVLPGDDTFAPLRSRFPDHPGARAVIRIAVDRVSTSCGYSIPRLSLDGERSMLHEWADRKSEDELVAYRAEKNARSIDGLPALG